MRKSLGGGGGGRRLGRGAVVALALGAGGACAPGPASFAGDYDAEQRVTGGGLASLVRRGVAVREAAGAAGLTVRDADGPAAPSGPGGALCRVTVREAVGDQLAGADVACDELRDADAPGGACPYAARFAGLVGARTPAGAVLVEGVGEAWSQCGDGAAFPATFSLVLTPRADAGADGAAAPGR